ncbi:FUSC family protein [Paraburkholderia sp. RL17-337-BIB-A]
MTKNVVREWAAGDGLVWLHVLKTVSAALLALGIAMRMELPSPRTAMVTVFVLMQPMSGMVLAKSFYRVVGTAAGMIAALVLGGVLAQQPELYMLGMTLWIGACTAAAVRYRHFRWYSFVLAGYTAALIGIPNVMEPNNLFMAALTRVAEVMVGILCSSAVSALVLPLKSGTALQHSVRSLHMRFCAFAASVLGERVEHAAFEAHFADLVDEIVGFEAARGFASFDDPNIRVRGRRLARLNSEFMDVCTRLHMLHQWLKRLHAAQAGPVIAVATPYFHELSVLLTGQHNLTDTNEEHVANTALHLRQLQAGLPRRFLEARRSFEVSAPELLLDFDTTMELLHRFVNGFLHYTHTYASLADQNHVLERSVTKYTVRTSPYVVGFTFLRTVVTVAATAAFWIATDWPSGGLAVIGAAITCALCSTSANPSKFASQITGGTVLSVVVGYLVTCYAYPNIDGFPLLCAVLAPVMACGVMLATRPDTTGYGVGFCIFFGLLAGPDNPTVYGPDVLINNGIALIAAMVVSCVACAVIFPPQMPWRIEKMKRDLRRQMVLAGQGALAGLNQQFHSSTHDLMFQLRALLTKQSPQHREALRWMLVTLEVGQLVIDLRNDAINTGYAERLRPGWHKSIGAVRKNLADLFEQPDTGALERALLSVDVAIQMAQSVCDSLHDCLEKRDCVQRILGHLHFIRTSLLDRDAPLYAS